MRHLFDWSQHFVGCLTKPRDEVGQLVTTGRDLQKNANESSAAVIQQQLSLIVSRWSLLDEQTKEALNFLQVITHTHTQYFYGSSRYTWVSWYHTFILQ